MRQNLPATEQFMSQGTPTNVAVINLVFPFINKVMKFKSWLESKEIEDIDKLNMTRSLPLSRDKNPFAQISGLTRGFHLNTIVSRMLRPWQSTIEFFQNRKEQVAERMSKEMGMVDTRPLEDQKIFGIHKKFIGIDGKLNSNFMAAFDLFKNELSNAIHDLPFKTGQDVVANKIVDVLGPVKQYFSSYMRADDDFLKSLDKAFKINLAVFGTERVFIKGNPSHYSPTLANNFINFLQIVRDEFITIGEHLPTLGQPALERGKKEIIDVIDKKIDEYERVRDPLGWESRRA